MSSPTAVDSLVSGRSLEGSHSWVTGAGRGLGQGCAIALARLGSIVHVISRTESDLEETVNSITQLGEQGIVEVCDVTNRERVERLFAGQPVDVLINGAGTNIPQSLESITHESYDTVMSVNVEATLFVTQAAVRRMREVGRGGSIVMLSSQMGHVGGPQRIVYCTSKWAIEGMTKALAYELAPEKIRVNAVAPTFIETKMTKVGLRDAGFRDWVLGEIPLGRLGTVDEVAAAVAYLASPMSSMTTGTSLLVDGGWTAH